MHWRELSWIEFTLLFRNGEDSIFAKSHLWRDFVGVLISIRSWSSCLLTLKSRPLQKLKTHISKSSLDVINRIFTYLGDTKLLRLFDAWQSRSHFTAGRVRSHWSRTTASIPHMVGSFHWSEVKSFLLLSKASLDKFKSILDLVINGLQVLSVIDGACMAMQILINFQRPSRTCTLHVCFIFLFHKLRHIVILGG